MRRQEPTTKMEKAIRGPVKRALFMWVRKGRTSQGGLALVATVMALALVGALTAAALGGAFTALRISSFDLQDARAFYAAEAGAESSLAQIRLALQDGVLSDEELATIEPPDLEGFEFDGFHTQRVGAPEVETITDGPFAGLYAIAQDIEVHVEAENASGGAAAVIVGAKTQAIPVFQFGVFFEKDLEATNGPPMEFVGRVHANGNIYLSSNNAWYRQPITTPNAVYHDRKDSHQVYGGVYIDDASGNEVALDFDSRSHPDPDAFKAESEEKFDGRLKTAAHGVDSLSLPLPDGVSPYELILPRNEQDGDAERLTKLSWLADTRVLVDLGTILEKKTVCGPGGPDQNELWPQVTIERSGGLPVPSASEMCESFEWIWEAFHDDREGNYRDLLQINVDQLREWSQGLEPGQAMRAVYVRIAGTPATDEIDPLGDGVNPSVRMARGVELPGPFTVATEWPLYVWGDYNVVDKKAAALMSDALTILSEDWDDAEHQVDRSGDKTEALATTVNAAVIAGHSATPCDHEDPGCGSSPYGGGLENFPRFLERWYRDGGKVVFRYTGSLISLWTSQKTDGPWSGAYYSPPQREWSFDTDYENADLLPPGTPNVGSVLRTAFREGF